MRPERASASRPGAGSGFAQSQRVAAAGPRELRYIAFGTLCTTPKGG